VGSQQLSFLTEKIASNFKKRNGCEINQLILDPA